MVSQTARSRQMHEAVPAVFLLTCCRLLPLAAARRLVVAVV